jgi:hypothetical protein
MLGWKKDIGSVQTRKKIVIIAAVLQQNTDFVCYNRVQVSITASLRIYLIYFYVFLFHLLHLISQSVSLDREENVMC